MARVEAVCLSHKKGIVKKEQEQVEVVPGWGIKGDAHGGEWHRQISLLAGESIDKVKKLLPSLKKGAFAENIITRGVQLENLSIGDRLQLGGVVILEITQIGKECHNQGCAIKKATGDCIMPKEGLFAKVVTGGMIARNDEILINSCCQ